MKKITINDEEIAITDSVEIENYLSKLENMNSAEVRIGFDERELCILINKERAFFMFLEDKDGTNYVSYDKNEAEHPAEDFLLSNGQLDEYPKNMTKPKKIIFEVAKQFWQNGERHNKINWIEGRIELITREKESLLQTAFQ
jgi:hypothetical protein